MKKVLLLFFTLFFVVNVRAITYRGCDSSETARMKALINNINISYDYEMIDDSPIFSVTVNNITSEIYFVDSLNNNEYHYSDTNNGEITIGDYRNGRSGRYKFYSDNPNCRGLSLGSKYYSIPYYNYYYDDPMCEGVDITVCNKWGSSSFYKSEIENAVNKSKVDNNTETQELIEYEDTLVDKLVNIYVNYYIYILLSIIVICVVIMIISRKKNKFNI